MIQLSRSFFILTKERNDASASGLQVEQKSYDKHPENKDSRDDSTMRDNLCRYQGLIFPYTLCVCVCVCVYGVCRGRLKARGEDVLLLEQLYF